MQYSPLKFEFRSKDSNNETRTSSLGMSRKVAEIVFLGSKNSLMFRRNSRIIMSQSTTFSIGNSRFFTDRILSNDVSRLTEILRGRYHLPQTLVDVFLSDLINSLKQMQKINLQNDQRVPITVDFRYVGDLILEIAITHAFPVSKKYSLNLQGFLFVIEEPSWNTRATLRTWGSLVQKKISIGSFVDMSILETALLLLVMPPVEKERKQLTVLYEEICNFGGQV